jgi:large subunit ribosomal protein L29
MDAEKIRNLTGPELLHQQAELNDQLFRLKFQLKMGQTESLKKIRGLRKDVARYKTIIREQELGIAGKKAAPEVKAAKATKAPAAAKPEKSAAAKPVAAKPAKATKGPAAKKPAKASAGKKKGKK